MSTKQPAVAVVPRLNQQSPLSLLRPLLVRSGPLGVPCSNLWNMKRSISKESSEMCFIIHT